MVLDNLQVMKCVPCEGGVPPLSREEAAALLEQVSGWTLEDKRITKEIVFKDFVSAMAFLNRVAAIAEEEGHHPDFTLHSWNRVRFVISTHAIGGLSRNDFILAAKIDAVPVQKPAS